MNEIWLYGEIGDRFYGLTDAAGVIEQLPARGDVVLRLNSPGGDVFEGLAIYNALRRHKGQVRVEVDALAASAASLVAMGADTVAMAANSMIMIHNPWTITAGDQDELAKTAEVLGKVQAQLVDVYATRSGQPAATIGELMAAETWFTADEAIATGLADESTPALSVAACLREGQFRHVPRQLAARAAPRVEPIRSPALKSRQIAAFRLSR